MIGHSPDPFGWFATLIPVMLIGLYVQTGRRVTAERWVVVTTHVVVYALFLGQFFAMWGIVFGGPTWMLYTVYISASLGAGCLVGLALGLIEYLPKPKAPKKSPIENPPKVLDTPSDQHSHTGS